MVAGGVALFVLELLQVSIHSVRYGSITHLYLPCLTILYKQFVYIEFWAFLCYYTLQIRVYVLFTYIGREINDQQHSH